MKNIFLLFGFITFAPLLVHAQGADGVGSGREKIKMLEIGYLTRQLQLSTQEAEKFWPTFNKYRGELKAVVADKGIRDNLDREQKILDIRKKYRREFTNILDDTRGQQVYEVEDRFKAMVKREMQQRMKMRQEKTLPRRNYK